MTTIVKGSRIRARWFQAKKMGTFALAGMQAKVTGDWIEVVGEVKHVWGDHPTDPQKIQLSVLPDGKTKEILVDPAHVVAVMDETPVMELPLAHVTCSMCRNECYENTAHIHQDAWIGDECCWDERLRGSE